LHWRERVDGRGMVDVAVVGGGPAGLAFAIAAARERLHVIVLERRRQPLDKACGEGILPRGLCALESFGVRELIDPDECAALEGLRYLQEDGTSAEARFSRPALGVRRTALVKALRRRARALGVDLRDRCGVHTHRCDDDGVRIDTDDGELSARLLVAADGLASPIRRAAGLDQPIRGPRRFGIRRHLRLPPWSRFVEVHFVDGLECYVTPVGRERVGVAFLWEPRSGDSADFEALLERFPAVRARVSAARYETGPRGAGPLARSARARVANRLLLAGDAAGYLDALSGEGLSLAFGCALDVGALLPAAIARGATREALAPYEAIFARHYRRYALLTRSLLAIARRPRMRRAAVRWLAAHRQAFATALAWAVG
jgi:flavin-dependent dehydrogenase